MCMFHNTDGARRRSTEKQKNIKDEKDFKTVRVVCGEAVCDSRYKTGPRGGYVRARVRGSWQVTR